MAVPAGASASVHGCARLRRHPRRQRSGVPYFLYFAVALERLALFSQTAYWATRSLEISRSDIRRVYIPRLVPLISAITIPVLTLVIFVVIIAGTIGFYLLERGEFYLELGSRRCSSRCALAMLLVFALACGLWFSPLAPRARDVRRLTGYVLGFWYFLTPVMYPIDEIPSRLPVPREPQPDHGADRAGTNRV